MPCTTILVGKKATYDGSTMVARNEDSPSGQFTPKKFVVVHPEQQPRQYISVLSHVKIDLPDNPMRYTAMPNALKGEGIWAACGVNEKNVSMTATETLTANERLLAADPLVEYRAAQGEVGEANYLPEQVGGIGEEDIVTLCLPYINSAREGVLRLGALHEEFGTYELNGIAFQDQDEIWWFETLGGHHWMARKVPDNMYVVMPNQLGLDNFDFTDAYGDKKEYLCSADLLEFLNKHHLKLDLDDSFNPRTAFGTSSDADHVYNTPRAWVIQRFFNRNSSIWDGKNAEYRPDSDNLPWCRVPERKITPEDIKYVLSHHFQNTPYDPYATHGDSGLRGSFRPIGVNRNNVMGLVQIRPYVEEPLKSIEWIAYGSNVFNAMAPFYVQINTTPGYMANIGENANTDNFYWTSRIIGALADPHFNACSAHIERYQHEVGIKTRTILNKVDANFAEKHQKGEAIEKILEEANQLIADTVEKSTMDCLNKVLYTASCGMKNGFSRSDA